MNTEIIDLSLIPPVTMRLSNTQDMLPSTHLLQPQMRDAFVALPRHKHSLHTDSPYGLADKYPSYHQEYIQDGPAMIESFDPHTQQQATYPRPAHSMPAVLVTTYFATEVKCEGLPLSQNITRRKADFDQDEVSRRKVAHRVEQKSRSHASIRLNLPQEHVSDSVRLFTTSKLHRKIAAATMFKEWRTAKKPTLKHFTPPQLPPIGLIDIMFNYDPTNIDTFIEFLGSLATPAHSLKEKDTKFEPLSVELRSGQFNDWLRSLLPFAMALPTFRSLKAPGADDTSLLARCIRFANSSTEQQVCWAVHPAHVALIQERTNKYGTALL